MKSIRSRLAALVVGSLAAVAAVVIPAVGATSAPSPESIFPQCAWGAEWGAVSNIETVLANRALLLSPAPANGEDTSGPTGNSYWTLRYTYEPGETITLHGSYADARFESFQVYKVPFVSFPNDSLLDYEAVPDPGSVNPFVTAAKPGQHEHYTVTLSSEAQPGETNTLPLGPPGAEAGQADEITIRDFQQHSGVWAFPAPAVTFSYQGVSKVIPACSREQETFPTIAAGQPAATSSAATSDVAPQSAPADSAPTSAVSTPSSSQADSGSPGQIAQPVYALPPVSGGNTATKYMSATVVPPTNGEVLLVKGKLPTTEHGDTAEPWPQPGVDLRYWSICTSTAGGGGADVVNHLSPNRLWGGPVDWGCRDNDQLRLSGEGDYTIAVGTEARRAAIERIPGVTFLPFSQEFPGATAGLFIRNLLPTPSFEPTVATWPTDEKLTPAEAAAADEQVMGAYYPKLSFSTIPALEQAARQGH